MSINLLNVFECVCLFLEIQRHIVCYNIKVLVHVSITKKSFAIKFVADPSTKPAFVGNKAKRANIKKGATRKKARQVFKKTNISYSWSHKSSFFEKLDVLCFLLTLVLIFVLLDLTVSLSSAQCTVTRAALGNSPVLC